MVTLLYYHDDFLAHDTRQHPENATRIREVVTYLGGNQSTAAGVNTDESDQSEATFWRQFARGDVPLASTAQIELAHDPLHIARIEKVCRAGGGLVEADTAVSRDSFRAARRAVGAAVDAVDRVVGAADALNAFCLVRPPGHHALFDAPMGFCLFNNIAIAAEYAIETLEMNRVLIVDWDVHHGNGTQNRFYQNGRVGFFSVHRSPFYPGTGAADETGSGPGLGWTKNLPLKMGISRSDYLERVSGELTEFADQVRPELILVSAGFDSHRLDPIGSLGLETEDFIPLTKLVRQLADAHSCGRLVSLLEGGYNTDVLPACVAAHLQQLKA